MTTLERYDCGSASGYNTGGEMKPNTLGDWTPYADAQAALEARDAEIAALRARVTELERHNSIMRMCLDLGSESTLADIETQAARMIHERDAKIDALQAALAAARPVVETVARTAGFHGVATDAAEMVRRALALMDAAKAPEVRHATDEDIARHVMGLDGSQDPDDCPYCDYGGPLPNNHGTCPHCLRAGRVPKER